MVKYLLNSTQFIFTIIFILYWYFPFPFESFTSFENTRYSSKRNILRSLLCRINFLGSQTWKVSWRMTSPRSSILISQPSSIERWRASFAWKNRFYSVLMRGFIGFPCSHLSYIARNRQTDILYHIDILTLRGTDRQTSRPSFISPNSLSVEQERRSFSNSWYLVILKYWIFYRAWTEKIVSKFSLIIWIKHKKD